MVAQITITSVSHGELKIKFSCERVCATVTWAGNMQPHILHWISLIQPYKRLSYFCLMQKTWKRVVEKRPQPEKHFLSSKKISQRNFRSFARTKDNLHHRDWAKWRSFKQSFSEKSNVVCCGVAAMFQKFCASVYRAPGKIWAFKFWKRNLRVLSRCVSRLKRNLYKNCVFLFCVFHSVTKSFPSWIKRGLLCRVCLSNVQTGGFSCFFLLEKNNVQIGNF